MMWLVDLEGWREVHFKLFSLSIALFGRINLTLSGQIVDR